MVYTRYVEEAGVRDQEIRAALRIVGYGAAPAMVLVMVLSFSGLLARGVARADVLVLLVVGLVASALARFWRRPVGP
jgi:hypothetical protein